MEKMGRGRELRRGDKGMFRRGLRSPMFSLHGKRTACFTLFRMRISIREPQIADGMEYAYAVRRRFRRVRPGGKTGPASIRFPASAVPADGNDS